MDERSLQEKIKKLADELKQKGVAVSEAQAKMMAESILKTQQKQTSSYEERKHDPTTNPQQRKKVAEPAQSAAPKQNVATDVNQEKPIKDLLAEQSAKPEVVTAPVQDDDEEFMDLVEETRESSDPAGAGPKQATQSPQESVATQPKPESAPQQTDAVKEAPTQPPVQKSEGDTEKAAPEKKEEKSEPKAEQKVDLSEMFNFSKRK